MEIDGKRASLLTLGLFGLIGTASAAWPPSVPLDTVVTVRDNSGIQRVGKVARGGLPLAASQAVFDVSRLRLLAPGGTEVPASFTVLSSWLGQVDDPQRPIQWVLVEAEAPPTSLQAQHYRVRTDAPPGSGPAPTLALTVTSQADGYLINTGAAQFFLSTQTGSAIETMASSEGIPVAQGQPVHVMVDGQNWTTSALRFARIDRQTAHGVVLSMEWALNAPAVGGGLLSLRRQYQIDAGDVGVQIRNELRWEGSRCAVDERSCAEGVNAREVQQVRDTWVAANGGGPIHVLADNDLAASTLTLSTAESLALRQLQRASQSEPARYVLERNAVEIASGIEADGGALAMNIGQHSLGLALSEMERYEPQALRVLTEGRLSIDWVDAPGVPLGNHQGLFADLRVALMPANPDTTTLLHELNSPLVHPLRWWPEAAQVGASQAFGELPVGPLDASYSNFDTLVEGTLQRTTNRFFDKGLSGLMTTGVWPFYWGESWAGPIGCGEEEPTPQTAADDAYWCASWTDYHNASLVATLAALRQGNPQWFDRIAVQAAKRMLHTVRMQCGPTDTWFYCDQFPAGGGGYRYNFNSSHAYVEGLIAYYFLTGDPWVTDALRRGARAMRGYLCPARASTPPGPMCDPTEAGGDAWLQVSDRAASQWYSVFHFLGETVDASFLDDWQGGLARWLSLWWAQGNLDGQSLGLLAPSGVGAGVSITQPGSYESAQLWMASGYDFEQLSRWSIASADTPLGQPALEPSSVMIAWARTLSHAAHQAPGDGSAAGTWPNSLDFTWSGQRVGGVLSDVRPFWLPDAQPSPCWDACLYAPGKAFLSAALARGAQLSADPTLLMLADDVVRFAIQSAIDADLPLGKESGEYLVRLGAAVARLSATSAEPLFSDGFE